MKFRTIIFSFVFLSLSFSCLFSMRRRVAEEQEDVTRGKVVYDDILRHIRSQDDQDVAADIVAENTIAAAFEKAKKSIPEITEGLSGIAKGFSKLATNMLLKRAGKKRQEIVSEVKKALIEKSALSVDGRDDVVVVEQEACPWAEERLEDFTTGEGYENKKILFDILCFSMNFAKENKDVFKKVMSMVTPPIAKVVTGIISVFFDLNSAIHKKLVETIPELEVQVHEEFFGSSQEEEGEVVADVDKSRTDQPQEDKKNCIVM